MIGGRSLLGPVLIGADGAWSKVRRAVSPATPRYTGISFLEAWFHDVDNRHPDIAELVGRGSAAAADGERGLFAQRNGGDHIRVHLIQRLPADWITAAGLTDRDTDTVRALLLDRYRDWSPRLRRLITDNDGRYVDRPLHALPVPHTWEHDPTVTLLGDVTHLMPPLGVGVNLAVLDACELALAGHGHRRRRRPRLREDHAAPFRRHAAPPRRPRRRPALRRTARPHRRWRPLTPTADRPPCPDRPAPGTRSRHGRAAGAGRRRPGWRR